MQITINTTDAARQQFWKEEQDFKEEGNPGEVINVYPELTYQEIKGFGGAFTEAAAYNWSLLSKEKQKEVIKDYFSEQGLSYNMGRTHINSCDFALGNYDYLTEDGFEITREEKYVIPMIKQAQAESRQEIILLASPWSPPAYMKTNGEMNHGGKLKKECYQEWADYIVTYLKACQDRGIKISMLTVQNEPEAKQTWDSCLYTTGEEKEFATEYLSAALEKNGFGDVKILIWDHNKERLYDRAKEVLSDEKTRKKIAGVAFHWYTGDHFDAISLVHQCFLEQELYFTEGCVEYSRFAGTDEVEKAEMYAHDMIGNFQAGMNGYLDWNLLLDEKGGPNHVGNYCAAPIMCNIKENTVEKRLPYYYIGHLSKHVKRGARRIATTKYTDKIDVVAFKNPNGERVVVLLNRTENDLPITLREQGEEVSFIIESHTIKTVHIK